MSELVRQQDLPPPGGYRPIPYIRQPAKTYFKGRTLFAIYGAITFTGGCLYYFNNRQIQKELVEMRSSKLAIYPMLLAETEREHLKTLYRNREEEKKLMANVEGWKVGTWYGEPIYKTLGNDTYIRPIFDEYYVHCSTKDTDRVANMRHYT
ncbi:NADH dehydrogenase (ubiquinone) B16.6 subunit [Arctopsyche grandis]|uniref:NADH dehydrogenase (ubiquinone) B16.6 subunit n=1 Tax=Arctopsyche grandis TaxID=121162 RepID=UPI00406D6822